MADRAGHTAEKDAHHPDCYQNTGVPADLPPNLCDCRVLRMIEARCPRCGGPNGNHALVHIRHGNGGGHNEPCPLSPEGGNDA